MSAEWMAVALALVGVVHTAVWAVVTLWCSPHFLERLDKLRKDSDALRLALDNGTGSIVPDDHPEKYTRKVEDAKERLRRQLRTEWGRRRLVLRWLFRGLLP